MFPRRVSSSLGVACVRNTRGVSSRDAVALGGCRLATASDRWSHDPRVSRGRGRAETKGLADWDWRIPAGTRTCTCRGSGPYACPGPPIAASRPSHGPGQGRGRGGRGQRRNGTDEAARLHVCIDSPRMIWRNKSKKKEKNKQSCHHWQLARIDTARCGAA